MSESDKKTENKRKADGRFVEGNKESPGRPKGSKNKFTELKEAFLEAFEELGGVDGLVKWARKNNKCQGEFYKMVAKMLPSNVGIEGSIKHEHRLSMVDLKKSMEECKK